MATTFRNAQAQGRTATLVVAASDAPVLTRSQADYICDGTADEVEINAAIQALPTMGGKVLLSEGTFTLAASVIPVSKLHLQGVGSGLEIKNGGTLLKMGNTKNVSVIRNTTGVDMTDVIFSDLRIDGNRTNNLTNGHGIDLTRIQAQVRNFHITACRENGIYADNTAAASKFEILLNGKVDYATGAGIRMTNCDGSILDTVTVDSCDSHGFHLGSWGTLLVMRNLFAGLNAGRGIYVTTIGYVYGEDLWAEQNVQRGIMLETLSKCHLSHLYAKENNSTPEGGSSHQISVLTPNGVSLHGIDIYSTVANDYGLVVVGAGGKNFFAFGGRIELTAAGATGIYLGGDATNGQYRLNGIGIEAAATKVTVEAAIGGKVGLRDITGYNPVGVLGPPAMPATTVVYTNAYGVDCTVHVYGGTIQDLYIGGSNAGLTSGTFRVPAGQTIRIDYTVTPTWRWFGD